MPKLGRRNEIAELEYMWRDNMTTRIAPFGTMDTPSMRTKIIAGRPVMVTEDRNKYPKKHQTIEDLSPPGGSPRRRVRGPDGSLRLEPLTEKPNHFDPTPFMSPRHAGYDSQDARTDPPSRGYGTMNPHRVVPPIVPSSHDPGDGVSSITYRSIPPAPNDITDLLRYLPKDSFLPRSPATYTQKEELELRWRVHKDLKGFDHARLRDIYTELTGYDRHLTGLVNFQDMKFTLARSQLNITALHFRLAAAMFVSLTEPEKVNYEAFLAFLASCQHRPDLAFNNSQDHRQEDEARPDPGMVYNVITHEDDDYRKKTKQKVPDNDPYRVGPQSQKFPYQDRENAKLLRYIEQQLRDAADPVDFERAWDIFSRTDRDKRGTLSREQIKHLAFTCGIPLQDSLVNQIIDRCDHSNGQHRWEQFLEFIGRVAPKKTGLKIPESKKPTEFVKHYPAPNVDWPKGEWDDMEYGRPRNVRKTHRPAHNPETPTASPARSQATDSQAQQDVDPSDMLPSSRWHPRSEALEQLDERARHLSERDRKHRELEKLDKEPENPVNREAGESESWFDRFMKMATALYDRDATNSGYLPFDDVYWLTQEYNRTFNLRIPEESLRRIVKSYEQDGRVNVNLLLKDLGLQGP